MSAGAYDAVVVGAGPNGLAAGVELARAGRKVLLIEAASTVGGGCRSAELTLPGFVHDVCSAIHPLGVGSPFFRSLPLADHGLEWVRPPIDAAHPFDDGGAAVLSGSVEQTAAGLGEDGDAYRRLMGPLVRDWERIAPTVLGPLRLPRHPLAMARFGLKAIQSAEWLASGAFGGGRARSGREAGGRRPAAGLFAGMAAHATLPFDRLATAAVGLILAIAGHRHGWPMPRGGAQKIADALTSLFRSLGGEVRLSTPVESMDQLPRADAYLFDVTPRQLLRIAGDALPPRYRRRLERFRYGAGVFKVDWALDGPIPWAAEPCRRAGTVHLGGDFRDIAAAERAVWHGEHPERPFVLLAQQSVFDPGRAPAGKHTGWAYCHVPPGSTVDMTEGIERQVERYAPGFGDLILARHTFNTADMERYNANYIGGDIGGGRQDLGQVFFRPTVSFNPYATANPKLFLCSSSTPPGGGVHGMCGYHAARAVMRRWGII